MLRYIDKFSRDVFKSMPIKLLNWVHFTDECHKGCYKPSGGGGYYEPNESILSLCSMYSLVHNTPSCPIWPQFVLPFSLSYVQFVVIAAFYEGKWHMRYIRQCAREGELDGGHMNQDWNCFDKIGTYRVKVKYCHCIVDGCNAAAHVKLSRNIALIPIGILLLRQWLF